MQALCAGWLPGRPAGVLPKKLRENPEACGIRGRGPWAKDVGKDEEPTV